MRAGTLRFAKWQYTTLPSVLWKHKSRAHKQNGAKDCEEGRREGRATARSEWERVAIEGGGWRAMDEGLESGKRQEAGGMAKAKLCVNLIEAKFNFIMYIITIVVTFERRHFIPFYLPPRARARASVCELKFCQFLSNFRALSDRHSIKGITHNGRLQIHFSAASFSQREKVLYSTESEYTRFVCVENLFHSPKNVGKYIVYEKLLVNRNA